MANHLSFEMENMENLLLAVIIQNVSIFKKKKNKKKLLWIVLFVKKVKLLREKLVRVKYSGDVITIQNVKLRHGINLQEKYVQNVAN